jgi:hypothetical protein
MRKNLLLLITAICASVILAGCPTTTEDTTAPTVTETAPIDNATNVALDPVITVTFSEAMDEATINADTILLKQGDTIVAAAVSYAEMVATITPTDPLSASTAYTIRVTTAVRDAAANALAEAVEAGFTTAIHVSAWAGPGTIENLTGACDEPVVAASSNGTAVCVFLCGNNAYAVRFDGSTWGTPAALESGSGNCHFPRVAITPSGNAMAVWMQYDATPHLGVWASIYTASTDSWSAATELDEDTTGTTYDCYVPDVAYSRNGSEAMVAWVQMNGAGSAFMKAKRRTTSWGSLSTISTQPLSMGASASVATCEQYAPRVAYDSHGYAVAAWSYANALYTSWCIAGTWNVPETNVGSSDHAIAMATDGNGNTYVAGYVLGNNTGTSNTFTGTAWGTAYSWTGQPGICNGSISASTSGDVILLHCISDGTTYHLFSVKKPAGDDWGAAAQLDTETTAGNHASWPSIAFDSLENAMAVWIQYNTSTGATDLWMSRYQGTAFSTPAKIDIGAGEIPSRASLAAGKNGKQFVVWPQNDGTHLNIYCNIYNP